ncbi:Hypothetical_protein [Hexamita inflata]|uniref:Hypothetical_protein n=1 Tax=Hexamita inflata TaxID=28002 RepID=A0AA86U6V3_9EUKA|nr:Hypothetical protein HINF_LOCUS32775 [Hexamita inflata]CAI9945135.1 Hypothetical protein HINF_LOCUS32780 [Hexamita inflata]
MKILQFILLLHVFLVQFRFFVGLVSFLCEYTIIVHITAAAVLDSKNILRADLFFILLEWQCQQRSQQQRNDNTMLQFVAYKSKMYSENILKLCNTTFCYVFLIENIFNDTL